ncbi:MAG: AAA family ATPase, partial [Candidatus Dadabacteria bacterium]|nr:AAA family ATPase [Candidatus Dadabacteria bacterium]
VAKTDTTVLIRGETGTGKELIARAIHNLSLRKDRPLIKVNCPAIPSGLIESELFGHEKGAFTTAVNQKIGKFELADRGTIFLDELGDLPLEAQAKLLRVLQEKEFERVGGTRSIKVDVRIIAATNRSLEEAVSAGTFRSDLFFRLNVFPVNVPPLRERKEDIMLLAKYFIQKYMNKLGKDLKSVSDSTLKGLMEYRWPGNIRELENIIERAVILSTNDKLNIPNDLFRTDNISSDSIQKLDDLEKNHIFNTL